MPTRRAWLAAVATVGAGGCVGRRAREGTPTGTADQTDGSADRDSATPPPSDGRYWYTHPQPTGNRRLAGSGAVRDAEPVVLDTAGTPRWLVATPATEGSYWSVATGDGTVEQWAVTADGTSRLSQTGTLPTGTPPVVADTGDGPQVVAPPADASSLSAPMVWSGDGRRRFVSVTRDGGLAVGDERIAVGAPPDVRPAALGDGRYAVFARRTDRYRHGALGDTTEPSSLAIVDAAERSVVTEHRLDPPLVFEGLQPLVADLDGDGRPEIVTTVADSAGGARIAVFGPDGSRLATGPVYGSGWRHQLAVARLGPDGGPALAVVRKPHVERVLEIYRLDGGSLSVVGTLDGFASHTYGSRVLDGAVAGDLDGDGRAELLVPTTARDTLAAVRYGTDGPAQVWTLPLDGTLRTNVTGVALSDRRVAVGAGTGTAVRVWQG